VCGLAGCVLALPLLAAEGRRLTCLDLQPQANQKLKDGYGSDDNNLAALPAGEQTFAGVKFHIGESLILLSGRDSTEDKPEKAEGIKVNAKLSKLYFLHATHWSGKDGAIIGSYTVNYDDKSQETIPIVYGKDVLDWWFNDDSKEPTRGKVAWKGDNDDAKNNGSRVRLYLTTWKNPEPTRKVVSIDFASTNSEKAAPFCVAITAEE
jgi:beta-galactosidase